MGPTELVSGLFTMTFAVKIQNTIGVRINLMGTMIILQSFRKTANILKINLTLSNVK